MQSDIPNMVTFQPSLYNITVTSDTSTLTYYTKNIYISDQNGAYQFVAIKIDFL